MRSRRTWGIWLSTLLVVALLIACSWYYLQTPGGESEGQQSLGSVNLETLRETTSGPLNQSPLDESRTDGGFQRLPAVTSVYRALAIGEIAAVARDLREADPDVLKMIEAAISTCSRIASSDIEQYVELQARRLVPDGAQGRASFLEYSRQRARFCVGFDKEELALVAANLAMLQGASGSMREAEVLQQLANLDESELVRDDVVASTWQVIDHTTSPANFLAAAEIAAIAGTGRLGGLDEYLTGTPLAERSTALRLLGAELAFCKMSGGCGPGTYHAMEFCNLHSVCRPGVSFEDVLVVGFSTVEQQFIREVARRLGREE